jgi:hypothetical protein
MKSNPCRWETRFTNGPAARLPSAGVTPVARCPALQPQARADGKFGIECNLTHLTHFTDRKGRHGRPVPLCLAHHESGASGCLGQVRHSCRAARDWANVRKLAFWKMSPGAILLHHPTSGSAAGKMTLRTAAWPTARYQNSAPQKIQTSMQFSPEEQAILQYQQALPPAAPEPQEGFVVTRAWLDAHKSRTGFWKPKQLAALGVEWPPRRGWLARVKGSVITQTNRLVFESFCP